MPIVSAATLRSYFEENDSPSSSQFSDLIASFAHLVSAAGTAARFAALGAGTPGQNAFAATTTASAAGAFGGGTAGRETFGAATTASAIRSLGVGAAGSAVMAAATTAAARNALDLTVGAVGSAVLTTGTTAAAQQQLGGGTVGRNLFDASTTASAANQLNVGGGGTTLIVGVTATGATIDLTAGNAPNAFNGTYGGLLLRLQNMVPATDSVCLRLRVSQDAGATFDATARYTWRNYTIQDNSTAVATNNDFAAAADTSITIQGSADTGPASPMGNQLGEAGDFEIHVSDPADGTRTKRFHWTGVFFNALLYENSGVGHYYANVNAINGLRVYYSSGNHSAGRVMLYGKARS